MYGRELTHVTLNHNSRKSQVKPDEAFRLLLLTAILPSFREFVDEKLWTWFKMFRCNCVQVERECFVFVSLLVQHVDLHELIRTRLDSETYTCDVSFFML